MSSQRETSDQLSAHNNPHAKDIHDIPKESIDRLHYLNYMSSTCRIIGRREGAATRGTRSTYPHNQ